MVVNDDTEGVSLQALIGYTPSVMAVCLVIEERSVKGRRGFVEVRVLFVLTGRWLYLTGVALHSTSASQQQKIH